MREVDELKECYLVKEECSSIQIFYSQIIRTKLEREKVLKRQIHFRQRSSRDAAVISCITVLIFQPGYITKPKYTIIFIPPGNTAAVLEPGQASFL